MRERERNKNETELNRNRNFTFGPQLHLAHLLHLLSSPSIKSPPWKAIFLIYPTFFHYQKHLFQKMSKRLFFFRAQKRPRVRKLKKIIYQTTYTYNDIFYRNTCDALLHHQSLHNRWHYTIPKKEQTSTQLIRRLTNGLSEGNYLF